MADDVRTVRDGSEALAADRERERQLQSLIGLSDRFGNSLAGAFAKSIAEGRRLDEVLKRVGQSFVEGGLKMAFAPLQALVNRAAGSLAQGLLGAVLPQGMSGTGSPLPFARGGVISRGMVMPFAQGGVVAAPTYFPLGRGMGLMGERGAEAVMPLARGPDGRLGVQGGGGRPVSVTVHIATPDVEGFRRSEAQVSAALARAVARGQRGM